MPRLPSGAHYAESGSGAPVVLLHSGGMSSRQWGRLIPRLSPRFRTLALDFLGYAASAPASDAFTIQDDIDAALQLIDSLDEPPHLIGHSYGGLVALSVARARPLRTLTVCEPVAFGVLHSTNDAEGLADLAAYGTSSTFGVSPGSEAWLTRFIEYWNGPGAWDALPAPTREAFVRVGKKVYQEVAGILDERTPHDAYRALAMPTLIVRGERTTKASQRVCAILAATIPRAELHVVEGAGHMAPLTHADRVNALIEAFLG